MNDLKNILIAWLCTSSSIFAAIEAKTVITILSAIVLPVLFFIIGKSVDVLLQIYMRNRDDNRKKDRKLS